MIARRSSTGAIATLRRSLVEEAIYGEPGDRPVPPSLPERAPPDHQPAHRGRPAFIPDKTDARDPGDDHELLGGIAIAGGRDRRRRIVMTRRATKRLERAPPGLDAKGRAKLLHAAAKER